eukprot:TRINITY_DN5605_c0_g1_i2.p1 TRINITY_DN5605_c0_g1~~TRINITY_DN5605_c0_g1_i2.p1  ORF type:complete len:119 (-),score=29.19 TRINITY_DN5605_c0_g1_i2:142-498(-)
MKVLLVVLACLACFINTNALDVFFQAPFDIVNVDGSLKDAAHTYWQLKQLRAMGAEGLHVNVWWGIVEQEEGVFNFDAYVKLVQMHKSLGMHMKAELSFHKCGGGTKCGGSLDNVSEK